ncbi:MAG: toprim domain-containing protein, partial [Gammaproteobacteria bacterium]|nr:toprim domain-containing protein [Gammaproteobacteria bacterium]
MLNHSLKHVGKSFSLNDIKQQFTTRISEVGIKPPQQLIADGKIHRFSTTDRPSDDAGWYVLYADGFPAGAFGDWRTSTKETWRADVGRPLSDAERQHLVEREQAIQQAREIDRDTRWKQARNRAEEIWAKAETEPPDHPYLEKKSVKAYALKANSSSLIVPLRIGQTLHSLQFINAVGDKRFLTGGRKKGCYHLIGEPGEALCVAEGYATAASIYEATGYAVAVAFDAGNLQPVGMELADRYPGARLLFCADDDRTTESNPGVSKATNAAEATGGLIAVPSFPAGTSGTDFNDLYQACGSDAVRAAIDTALAWPAPEPISVALERKQYPIEVLPPAIRDAVQEVQSFVQASTSMIATSAF